MTKLLCWGVCLPLTLAAKGAMDWAFAVFVSRYYGSDGFILSPGVAKLTESYGILLVVYAFLPKGKDRFSNLALQFLFLVMLLPILSAYGMQGLARSSVVLLSGGFLITCGVVRWMPRLRVPSLRNGRRYLTVVFGTIAALALGVFARFGVPSLVALDMSRIYETRAAFGESLTRGLVYLLNWQANVVGPLAIAVGCTTAKWTLLALAILLQLFLYLHTGFRSVLFAPFLVLGTMLAVWAGRFYRLIAAGIALTTLGSVLFFMLGGSIYAPAIAVERILFVPAQIAFRYLGFFSEHPKLLLSHSILGSFLANPYGRNPIYMMGELFYGRTNVSMNTGFLSDAYMNFGVVGVIVFSAVLGLILNLFDSFSRRVPMPVVMAIAIMPLFSLVNSALVTTFFTHGMFLALIGVYLYGQGQREPLDGHA